jgi:dTDP-6-deoxy-L-talose 4-dehydrogenase (NAD+)
MRLALTGTTGFLGRSLLPAALRAGHQVTALVRPGRAVPAASGLQLVEGDLSTPGPLRRLVNGAEVVIHLAAVGVQGRDREPAAMEVANVAGAARVCEAMAAAGVVRLVAAGTVLELAPLDPYGASKVAGREALAAAAARLGLGGWYLRLASLYGPDDDAEKLLPSAVAAALAGRNFPMTPGAQLREWLHVEDAVAALLAAAARPPPPGLTALDVGTGQGVALVQLVRQVYRLAGADEGLVQAGARPYRAGEVMRLVGDPAAASAALDWAPKVSLEEGLLRLVGRPRGEEP